MAELLINGQSYTIGPYRSAGVTTNAAGIVSVAFPADRLAAPTLLVSIPSVMTDNESVAVNLHTEVVAKLQDLTGAQLAGAKDASGNLILQPRYQASADAVAQAVSQSVHLGRNLLDASTSVKYLHPLRNKRGVAYFAGDKASLRNIHFPLVDDGHWSIRFEGSGATFTQLTAEQARARIQEKRTTLKRANGFFDWLEEIGDFIEGILEEVVNVLEIIVSKIGAAVQAVIHFVIEGVEYVFDAIVETVEHAIDLAESVFAQVAVAFEQLAEWLGFLFNWPDILRTQAAVSHTIDVALDLARLGAGAARKALDAKFAALQQEISDKFQGWIQGLQPDDRVGGYVAGSTPYNAGLSDSMSNNIVLNAFLDNASTATGPGAVKLLSFGRSLDNVQSEIAAFANATEKTDSYGSVRGLFQDISGSRDGFFTQALARLLSLLQALLQAAVAGVQTVLDAVLEAVEDLIGALQSALGEAWNIPLLSDLFAYITNGATLSAQSLLSLIVAIPVTIFYKLVNGAAPFPDDSSVAAFQAQVTAQGLLDLILPPGAALAPAASTAASSWSGSVPLNAAKALSVTASVSAAFTGVLSAMVDTVDGPAPPVLNAVRLGCKGLGLVSSCPYFYKKSPAVFPLVWVFDAVSYGLDIVFVASQTSIPGDVKAVTTSFLGIGRIALGVVQEGQAGFKNPYAIVNDIAGSAPMVAKVLKTKPVYQASGGLSLVLLCAIDIGMGLAVAGLGYASRDLVLSPA